MPMIYAISPQGYWTGAFREIGERDGMPRGWTRIPVPDLASDEYAAWNGSGWNVTTEPPPKPEPPPPLVPQSVARWRARAALRLAELLDAVEAAVAASDVATQEWWAAGLEMERADPRVAAIASGLGLTDEQIDDLFRQAAAL